MSQGLLFEPIHKAHAIAEMVVFFEFSPPAFGQSGAASLPVAELLPDFNVDQEKQYQVDLTSPEVITAPVLAYTARRGGNPTKPDWIVRVDPVAISIHCLTYTRWDLVWPDARAVISNLFRGLPADNSFALQNLGLRYLDQFIFRGNKEDYDPSLLLNRNSALLHPRAFKSGPRWHTHTGWFEETDDGSCEILNQLKVNALIPAPNSPVTEPTIMIEHIQHLRPDEKAALTKFLTPPTEGGPLDALMQELHVKNKVAMVELLQKNVASSMNLSARKKAK